MLGESKREALARSRDVAFATMFDAPKLPPGSRVEQTTLARAEWPCVSCGRMLKRGDRIRVTITPGGGRNRVEHDPVCLTKPRRPA